MQLKQTFTITSLSKILINNDFVELLLAADLLWFTSLFR